MYIADFGTNQMLVLISNHVLIAWCQQKNPQLQSHQINYIPIFECLKSHQINDIPINLMLDISSSEALQNNDSSNYGPNMDQTTAQTTAPCAWGIARDQPTDGRRALVLFLGDATNRKF